MIFFVKMQLVLSMQFLSMMTHFEINVVTEFNKYIGYFIWLIFNSYV